MPALYLLPLPLLMIVVSIEIRMASRQLPPRPEHGVYFVNAPFDSSVPGAIKPRLSAPAQQNEACNRPCPSCGH